MSISEGLYHLGVRMRNKMIFANYEFLMKTQYWERDELLAYQYNKIRMLLDHATRNSDYYKKNANQYDLSKIKSLSDVSLLPVLTKEELLANSKIIQVRDLKEKMYYSETSGSTGRPLIFFRNQDWDAWHNASVFRGMAWYGIKPWEKNGYLWGYNFSPLQRIKTILFDKLQNRFRLFSYKEKEIAAFCDKLKNARYLNGYSSMIYEIAKYLNRHPEVKRKVKLKLIKGTSEKIHDSYQKESVLAFGRKIVSEYGSAEGGIIAFECEEGNMHINMETVFVEEIDSEIVVTNLVSKSFPIIRYKLGDYISLDKVTKCPCGRESYIIKDVTGRVGKNIVGITNNYPSLTLYYIFKNLAINKKMVFNYQVVQKKKGELLFKLEQRPNKFELLALTSEIKKYFKNDIMVTFQTGVVLKIKQAKQKDFISLL